MRRLRGRVVQLGDQVRVGDRLAELLGAHRAGSRGPARGPYPGYGSHRGHVRPVRRPPRARLPRWARPHRRPLLHELDRTGTRSGTGTGVGGNIVPTKKSPAKKSTAKKSTAKKTTAKTTTRKTAAARKSTAAAAATGVPARRGDVIVVDSRQVGSPPREGEVLEVIEGGVGVSYRVKWVDGHESIFTPAGGILHRA